MRSPRWIFLPMITTAWVLASSIHKRPGARFKWTSAILSILDAHFDVVVLNRCLQFFPDPLAYLEHVKDRVAPWRTPDSDRA